MQASGELEELRIALDRIRTLLDNLVVRGLRACGTDELTQLAAFAEHLEQCGAGHLASLLADLRGEIERDERTAPRKLLEAQTNVRLLERLLTLRVVQGNYAAALEALAGSPDDAGDADMDSDEAEETAEDSDEE
jgi:hypothetical protein